MRGVKRHHRLRLRLGRRRRSPIRLRVLDSARPDVIHAPEGGVVPVRIYAVGAVAVRAAILPPIAIVREGVLVPIRTIAIGGRIAARTARSEEHTSELQSHSDLVCRLLLEKK